ncbi:5-formyltetrahydrofolate cyclo-ligase [Tuberibacillus sp. Marseille-P3662]|uniref:5-formyltetrahydrofolate cyclo-ligase n=1 Tax=Tuberibacillus sp. Marseille-P3662 TaxID=1965358 RepID=UPI000A1CA12B|nr:5-formyltetrahydrofolate cyclo-ligase [Tuberibacillus sp. Marseille-P3662]
MKTAYRNQGKTVLKNLTLSERQAACQQIYERLYRQPEWLQAQTVGITISREMEIDTTPIIRQLWQDGRTVAVPKCLPETKQLVFRALTDFDQLEVVYYDLEEPKPSITPIIHSDEMDLVLVPGLLFSKNGYRIGYGGGYYDRFLPAYEGASISLAFDSQVVESLPTDHYDQPVDKIVTPGHIW